MIATDCFWVILIAMGLNAFSYNLVSGTREALTYDSLLEGGAEERYLKVSSIQENIYLGIFAMTNLLSVVTVALGYRKAYFISIVQGILSSFVAMVSSIQENIYLGIFAMTNLLSVVTVALGYRKAYFISIVQGILSSFVAMRLSEVNVGREKKKEKLTCADIRRELILYTGQSLGVLKKNPSVCRRMLLGGLVAAGCYVVNMMMQEHLVSCGLKAGWIGVPLLFISIFSMVGAALAGKTEQVQLKKLMMMMQEHLVSCGLKAGWIGVPLLFISIFSMVGAALAGKTEQVQLKKLMIVGSLAAGFFIAVSSSTVIAVSVFAAGMALGAEEVLMLRIESENQKVFSSDIRATMGSVSSMMYSIFMVIVSPLTGWAV